MPHQKPHILLVNDDGIGAAGLKALWRALREVSTMTVIAPRVPRSGAGLSITMYRPLHLEAAEGFEESPAFSLSGTPADCVKIALSELLTHPPDLIFSGINQGSNAGRNILYSGTIGATLEGALQGIPGVALSCLDIASPPFEEAASFAPTLLKLLLDHPLPPETLLNVNFPLKEKGPIKGMQMARQGRSFWKEAPDRRRHPEGHDYYWLGGFHAEFQEDPSSDIHLLEQSYVTVVPICATELTHQGVFESHGPLLKTPLVEQGPLLEPSP